MQIRPVNDLVYYESSVSRWFLSYHAVKYPSEVQEGMGSTSVGGLILLSLFHARVRLILFLCNSDIFYCFINYSGLSVA